VVKRPERDADGSPPFVVEIKKGCVYTSTEFKVESGL
jgi:hypothetical protein